MMSTAGSRSRTRRGTARCPDGVKSADGGRSGSGATSGRSPTTHQAKTARDMARVARGLGATISRMKSQNIVVWRTKSYANGH
jgi:hypothetical protein